MKIKIPPIFSEEVTEFSQPTFPVAVIEPAPTLVDSEIVALIFDEVREKNFFVGATVVNKRIPGEARKVASNWGIIVKHNEYIQKGARWSPLTIQWLNGSRQEMNVEDVVLINSAPSLYSLEKSVSCV